MEGGGAERVVGKAISGGGEASVCDHGVGVREVGEENRWVGICRVSTSLNAGPPSLPRAGERQCYASSAAQQEEGHLQSV